MHCSLLIHTTAIIKKKLLVNWGSLPTSESFARGISTKTRGNGGNATNATLTPCKINDSLWCV
jgi:hypothetical protein